MEENPIKINNVIKEENKGDDKNNNKYEVEILDSVGLKCTLYNDFIGRYFNKYYINKGKNNEQYIFIHSNGILMCGFGENNEILKQNITEVKSLKEIGKITGKNKNGAHFLCPTEYVINVKYIDQNNEEKSIKFCPNVKGKLLEINSQILAAPQALKDKPESDGFVCLISQTPEQLQLLKEKLDSLK